MIAEADPFAADERRARKIFEEYGSDSHWPDLETCVVCMAHAYLSLLSSVRSEKKQSGEAGR